MDTGHVSAREKYLRKAASIIVSRLKAAHSRQYADVSRTLRLNVHAISMPASDSLEDIMTVCDRIVGMYEKSVGDAHADFKPGETRRRYKRIIKTIDWLLLRLHRLRRNEYRVLLGNRVADTEWRLKSRGEVIAHFGWTKLRPSAVENDRNLIRIGFCEDLEAFRKLFEVGENFMSDYNATGPKSFSLAYTMPADWQLILHADQLFSHFGLEISSSRMESFDKFLSLLKAAAGIDNPKLSSLDNQIKRYKGLRSRCFELTQQLAREISASGSRDPRDLAYILELVSTDRDEKAEKRFGPSATLRALQLVCAFGELNREVFV